MEIPKNKCYFPTFSKEYLLLFIIFIIIIYINYSACLYRRVSQFNIHINTFLLVTESIHSTILRSVYIKGNNTLDCSVIPNVWGCGQYNDIIYRNIQKTTRKCFSFAFKKKKIHYKFHDNISSKNWWWISSHSTRMVWTPEVRIISCFPAWFENNPKSILCFSESKNIWSYKQVHMINGTNCLFD